MQVERPPSASEFYLVPVFMDNVYGIPHTSFGYRYFQDVIKKGALICLLERNRRK